jgi:hypothetical protein
LCPRRAGLPPGAGLSNRWRALLLSACGRSLWANNELLGGVLSWRRFVLPLPARRAVGRGVGGWVGVEGVWPWGSGAVPLGDGTSAPRLVPSSLPAPPTSPAPLACARQGGVCAASAPHGGTSLFPTRTTLCLTGVFRFCWPRVFALWPGGFLVVALPPMLVLTWDDHCRRSLPC